MRPRKSLENIEMTDQDYKYPGEIAGPGIFPNELRFISLERRQQLIKCRRVFACLNRGIKVDFKDYDKRHKLFRLTQTVGTHIDY